MRPQIVNVANAALIGILSVGHFPQLTLADDSARVSRLESEIQILRSRIDEQNRRITQLERELKARTTPPLIGTIPGRHAAQVPATTDAPPWHFRESWARIEQGMSEEEVTRILGEPTTVESMDSFKTLFYRGSTPGKGTLNGHVNLRDDRVVAVNEPSFWE